MLLDIVVPDGNEAEFAEVANKLGCKKIIFLYNFDGYNEKKAQKLELIRKNLNMLIETAITVSQGNMNKASKLSTMLVAKSSDSDRFFIESRKIKIIYGFESVQRKDYLHQRASGLNHVLCELAAKNNVTIGFSYSSLINQNPSAASLTIGRMMQNIALCQKYKVKTVIGSFSEKPFDLRTPHDVLSLFTMLGMDGKSAKETLNSI